LRSGERFGGAGTILLRHFALGTSTPSAGIRCKRGSSTQPQPLYELQRLYDYLVRLCKTLQLQHELAITFDLSISVGAPGDIAAEVSSSAR
jgi:hypothetical protein